MVFTKMRVAINVSNIHMGGALQVAVSFLSELALLNDDRASFIDVYASSCIALELSQLEVDVSCFSCYKIVDSQGLGAFFSDLNKDMKNYDLVFTLFGPNYLRVKTKKEIVGFAQSWILNFDNPISDRMSFLSRNVLRFKYFIQWLFFLRADHYVVELEHVKDGLITKKGVDQNIISVVYNTVSSLYKDKNKWKSIVINKHHEEISLGLVARDYPHKNINIFPMVAKALEDRHNIKAHFYTTLNDDEWKTKDDFFKRYVSTVGSLAPDQCPSFYEQLDAVVFPSLLECFSATPLEALVMGKPLFASDRGFVRDVCGEHAVYFDPLDANDIACNIANYFKADIDRSEQLKQARDHALGFSSAQGRAEQYLKIIQQYL